MKNTIIKVLTMLCLLSLLFSTLIFVVSCKGSVGDILENPLRRLDTPGGLRINNEFLEWNPVEYASRYLVSIDGMETYSEETRYSIAGISDGDHIMKVRAMGDGVAYESSDYSQELTINILDGSLTTSGYYSEFDDLTKNESFLGYGFDVIRSSTFSDKYIILSNPIFNNEELMQQRLLKVDSKMTYVDEIQSTSIEDFMEQWNVDANVNVSWGKKKVGGSVDVKAAYTGGSEETQSKYFHCITFNNQKFYIVLQSDMDSYREMLTDGFKKDLYSDMEPSKLFELYGTHFITSAVMGGRINSYYLYTSNEKVDFHDVSAAVSVDVRYLAGKTDVGVSGGYNSFAQSMNIDIKNTFEVIGGGDFGMNSDADIAKYYSDWEKSLDNHASLIGIKDSGSLRAIWELVDPELDTKVYEWCYEVRDSKTNEVIAVYEGTGSRAAQLEAYFFAYGVESYNELMSAAELPGVIVTEGIQGISVNGNESNYMGVYDVYSGTTNNVDFSPYPANATNANKSISIVSDSPFARINSNKQLVVDHDAEDGAIIELALSIGGIVENIKIRVIKTYCINYVTNWSSYSIPTSTAICGSQIEAPTMPNRDGKIFVGWYTTPNFDDGTLYNFGNQAIVDNITLYAKWIDYYPTISFSSNIPSWIIDDQYNPYNQAFSKPNDPEYHGYTFCGWYTDDRFVEGFDFTKPIISDTTIYVKWITNNYTVNFNSNGGTSIASQELPYQSKITKPLNPTKSGWQFMNWYKDEACTYIFDFENDLLTDNMTLHAKWGRGVIYISFNSNGGNDIDTITLEQGQSIGDNNLPIPTLVGSSFDGWYSDPNYSNKIYGDTQFIESTTLYAKWTPNTYYVLYDANGGTGTIPYTSHVFGIPSRLSSDIFTRTGYTFTGWNTEKDGSGVSYASNENIISIISEGSVCLYAQWKINTYTITFNSNGGSAVSTTDYVYNTVTNAPETPTRNGYAFAGWDIDFPNFAFGNLMPDCSITATAKWVKIISEVDFSVDAGTRDKTVTDADGVYDNVNTGLDIASLRSLGYTKLTISLTFDVYEINEGYKDVWIYNSNGTKLYTNEGMEFAGGWQRKTLTIVLNLSDITDGKFKIEWGAHGNFEDDWKLGWTHLTMTATK